MPFLTSGLCFPPPHPPHPPPEEFNDRILSPELSDSELQRLHGELQNIYQSYCLEESVDKISFDRFIVEEIRNSETCSSSSSSSLSSSASSLLLIMFHFFYLLLIIFALLFSYLLPHYISSLSLNSSISSSLFPHPPVLYFHCPFSILFHFLIFFFLFLLLSS